ncbi:hypothetical protein N7466_011172 [Penicillium verhagenii]|uniref:uncharacterized protein n=1 Tax=Penicillium verhagenii TaxID=1562060 RepID=UPI0025458A97|nr:uncharacterized protein N7466_011172 [Penicillium verhagenii]KAJ5917618.1 hypothetical protein N7466_011172 [Penicillium verhagenii]
MENPSSLTELSTLVERTLLDTGRLFRKSGSMPASTHLQRSIPSYYESFQDALDNLSEQIFIAKAFLEKDYEAIKAREAVPVTEDVAMRDVDEKMVQDTQPQPVNVKIELGTEPGPEIKAKAENEPPAPTEPAPGPEPSPDAIVKEESQTNTKGPTDQAFGAGTDGINFDSVLNETGGPSSFQLSLDFGDDDMGNQAFLSGTAFGTSAPGETPGTSQPENATAMAPAGGGAFDMELQKSEGEPHAFPDQGNSMDDLIGPGESSFDDLFMETENMGEDGTGDLDQLEGDSLMNLNELEDNWFS